MICLAVEGYFAKPLLEVVANIRFTGMVLDTEKIYIDAVIVEKKKAITANVLAVGAVRIINEN